MRVVTIIQARMGSTRLPGKVLLDIAGRTMLERVIRRAQQSRLAQETVVATTTLGRDEPIVERCRGWGVPCVRGPEEDVLARYHRAAEAHAADVVVRVTSDCPLLDATVTDRVIAAFLEGGCDYASNGLRRTYPRGLDAEAIAFGALARAHREAEAEHERIHVTPYLFGAPGRFRLRPVVEESGADHSRLRWTVDTAADLALVRAVYARLGPGDGFGWREVLALMEREPELAAINAHVEQKELGEG